MFTYEIDSSKLCERSVWVGGFGPLDVIFALIAAEKSRTTIRSYSRRGASVVSLHDGASV